MTILNRGCIFGTATYIQLEEWDEKDEMIIAVYPKVSHEQEEQPYYRKGMEIRFVLDKNFESNKQVKSIYQSIKSGRLSLANCKNHFHSEMDGKLLGY